MLASPCLCLTATDRRDAMYEQLFETKALTFAVMVLASLVAGALVSRPSMGLRSLVHNFVPSIAVAFYAVALVGDVSLDRLDLVGGLVFECVVLLVCVRVLADVYTTAHRMEAAEVRTALVRTVPMQLLLAAPLMSLDNFGIFADGSRIGYLGEAAWAKYLTYAGILLSAVQAPLLARRVTLHGRPTALGWLVVAVNAASSTLSGSKGAVFLWLLAVIALIDWRRARVRWSAVASFTVILLAGLGGTVFLLSNVLGLEPEEFVDLAFGRFLLSNDARALALDFRSVSSGSQDLMREAFRSLSGLFGYVPQGDPLGVLLYQELFGPTTESGANGSLMALITYYMPAGSAIAPALAATVVLLGLVAAGRWLSMAVGGGVARLCVLVASLVCANLFSQDFLAFQLAAPIALLLVLVIVALRVVQTPSSRQATPSSRA